MINENPSQPAPLIDIGVNLTSSRFEHDLEAVIERAANAGVQTLIITGTDEASSEEAIELCKRGLPGKCHSTCGVHPHNAKSFTASTQRQLNRLAAEKAVVAVGETGLDFNRDFSPRPTQIQVFEAQLELAAELQLPVFMHERDSHQTFLDIIRHYRHHLADAVVHCFTGSREALFNYLDLDLHIGITGWICDERRGRELQTLVRNIPLQRLMLETDAPYLLPHSLPSKPKGNRNEPAFLPWVLAGVAAHYPAQAAEIAQQTTATARRFFRLGN